MKGRVWTTIIGIYFLSLAILSIPYIISDVEELRNIHTIIRIADLLLRSFGAIALFIAIVGLWQQKKYGYSIGIWASILEILLRILIYLPTAKHVFFLSTVTNMLGIITFIPIILFFYHQKTKLN